MIFWIIASIVLVSAIAVVCMPNPLQSALCLVTNLVAVAALYAVLGAHFIAAVQITVYAGAIMVLVIFVIMLLNAKKESFGTLDISIFMFSVSALGFCAYVIAGSHMNLFADKKLYLSEQSALSVKQLGIEIFSTNPFLFQLSGVLLLTALVGAIVLANQRKKVVLKSFKENLQ